MLILFLAFTVKSPNILYTHSLVFLSSVYSLIHVGWLTQPPLHCMCLCDLLVMKSNISGPHLVDSLRSVHDFCRLRLPSQSPPLQIICDSTPYWFSPNFSTRDPLFLPIPEIPSVSLFFFPPRTVFKMPLFSKEWPVCEKQKFNLNYLCPKR